MAKITVFPAPMVCQLAFRSGKKDRFWFWCCPLLIGHGGRIDCISQFRFIALNVLAQGIAFKATLALVGHHL